MRGWGIRTVFLLMIVASATSAGAVDAPLNSRSIEERGIGFLRSLPRQWSGSSALDCRTYEDKNIEKLQPGFATSAAAFLQAFRKAHGDVVITSAHRTSQEQSCVCRGEKGPCAGRPRLVKKTKKGPAVVVRGISRHQLGIALDVRPGTGSRDEYGCLHEFAALNPRFGVHFPLGLRDRPHMEPSWRARLVSFSELQAASITVTPCTKMRVMLTHDPVD
jgi:hypothetical protein